MKRIILFFALFALVPAFAKTGDCWKTAESLSAGKSKTVTLVNEADPDDQKTHWDCGSYYLKITVKRDKDFTVFTSGVTEEDGIAVSVDDVGMYDFDKDGYTGSFQDITGDYSYRGYDTYLYYDGYGEEDDPSSMTFYISITGGEIGQSVTIAFKEGLVQPPRTPGTEDDPLALGAVSGTKAYSGTLIDGSFYFTANLTAGNKYKFWTSGGTEDCSLGLDVSAAPAEDEEMDEPELREILDGIGEHDQGYVVIPRNSGLHWVVVDGYDGRFTLNYGMVAARPPKDHPVKAAVKPVTAAGYEDESCEPGHRNDPNSGAFDSVIDQQLYKVTLVKDAQYAFETVGAEAAVVMELYDASGKVLKSSKGTTTSEFDCRIVYTCAKAGDYWVGVCEDLENDEEDEPSGQVIGFSARLLTGAETDHDEWDYADDTWQGASGLAPGMGEFTSHGPHTLGLADVVDTFRIDARDDIAYTVQSVLDESAGDRMRGYVLQGVLYTVTNGKRSAAKDDIVIEDLSSGYTIPAKSKGQGNVSYCIEVTVAGGEGYDYGPYEIVSKADSPSGIGALTVDIGGATYAEGATWSLASDGKNAPKYAGGATVHLVPGDYTVTFAAIKANWTKPDDLKVTVTDQETTVVSAKYSDTCDVVSDDAKLGDGSKDGKKLTTLKPAAKEASVSRSLWTNDAADWFKFAIAANTYYSFRLEESQKLGDAEIVICRENGEDVVARGRNIEFLCRETKGSYYAYVTHATSERVDSQYVMTFSTREVGGISFAKAALSVKDSATSVALTVNRTTKAAEGKVRVRYSTFAGTALPGQHYQPQSGFLEWEAGDKKAKTVTIDLIPDLVAHWEADRQFTVKLAALDPSDIAADEFVPALATPSVATVTIQDATKKATGTVVLTGAGVGNEPFENAKKPAVEVKAGEAVTLWFERTEGSDGKVAVTLTPTKGTAAADINFEAAPQTIVWENGEAGAKSATVRTLIADEGYMAAKNFTVKAAADKTVSADVVKVSASAVTVTIIDPKVTRTVEQYAADAKTAGVTVKAGKADTWYFDELGDLTSVLPAVGGSDTFTVTVTGPGRFVCLPLFDNGGNPANTCKVTVGKEKTPIELVSGVETEIRRYFEKGSTAVTFTLARDKKDTTEGPSLSFVDMGDGNPFGWTPLPTPELVSPLPGEILVADKCDEKITFRWTQPESEDIVYLFTLNKDKKNLGVKGDKFAAVPVEDGAFAVGVYCSDCVVGEREDQLASGSTYYWRVDTTFADPECKVVNVNPSVWTVTALECDSLRPVVAAGVNADGSDIVPDPESSGAVYKVSLMQAVSTEIAFGAENQTEGSALGFSLVKGSALPKGLAIGKDGRLTGAPSQAGEFKAVIQVSETKGDKKKSTTAGGTLLLDFVVESVGLASGTFNGVVETSDESLGYDDDGYVTADAAVRFGTCAVTATDAGKVSASVVIGGAKMSFSASGWSQVLTLDNGQPGVSVCITNIEKLTTAKVGKTPGTTVSVTNILKLVACCGAADDVEALDTPLEIRLERSFLNAAKSAVVPSVEYLGEAYRDNRKLDSQAERLAPFVGYYTISLAPTDWEDGVRGYGYLTMTVDAKGGAKMSGVLADGTAVSKAVVAEVADVKGEGVSGRPELRVPVCVQSKSTMLFGEMLVELDDDVPFVSTYSVLRWINTDTSAAFDGEHGFSIAIEPVGGFYNTIYNVQAYYLHYAFKIVDQEDNLWDLADYLLGEDEEFVCWPGMFEEYLNVAGNAITADKQVKVTRDVTVGKKVTKLVDWKKTVNPANIAMTFKQATGVYSGSFDLYKGSDFDDEGLETKQTKINTYKHQGVLLQARDVRSGELAFDDAVMPGFYLAPLTLPIEDSKKTRKFTASLPFVIAPEERIYDWENPDWQEELPVGANDEEADGDWI